jgi:DNA invertase Pin-like site-specific DNA recombinase
VRCAIYARKSSEEGLEQSFNSLDSQRESAEHFIASHAHEGWVCLSQRYEDGGFSGGNMDRPALRRLLADIEAGEVDCVVVYRADRITRSLMDFARIMDSLQAHEVSFVSLLPTVKVLNERDWRTKQWMSAINSEIEALRASTIDEDAARDALARFEPVWDALTPKVRCDLIRSLVENRPIRPTLDREGAQQGFVRTKLRTA